MRLICSAFAVTAVLAACGEASAPAASPEPARAAGPSAGAMPATPAQRAPATEPGADECGAAERQDWIGRARGDLPAAPDGANWRIHETGQPVTQDFRPDRLNIEIDPASQTVVRLSCG